jgi:hypothetical protein
MDSKSVGIKVGPKLINFTIHLDHQEYISRLIAYKAKAPPTYLFSDVDDLKDTLSAPADR